MDFSPWQLDRLRQGLLAYRALKATKGRQRPWRAILKDILLSEKTAHDFPEDGDAEPTFKEESLRRFAMGDEDSQPDKLQDIWLFLIERGILRRDELEEMGDQGVMAEGIAIYQRLGLSGGAAGVPLGELATTYRATRPHALGQEHIELTFRPGPVPALLRVQEELRVVATDEPVTARPRNELRGTRIWRGYGFFTSRTPTLHIFIRGNRPGDLIHYMRVGTASMHAMSALHLVRAGEYAPEVPPGPDQESLLPRYGVIRFLPDAAAPLYWPQPRQKLTFVKTGKEERA